MFNFLKKKQKSPVEFIDVSGYGSAKIQPKQPKVPSNMSVTKDGYVAISATDSLPYPQSSYPSSASQSSQSSEDMDFLGSMASASSSSSNSSAFSALDTPSSASSPYSTTYPSTNSSDDKTFKILRKLDFLADKLDLMEKKIARIERKTGVSFEDI